jgi:hypothetical protein
MISVASIPIIAQNHQLKLQEENTFKESNNSSKSEEVKKTGFTRLNYQLWSTLKQELKF